MMVPRVNKPACGTYPQELDLKFPTKKTYFGEKGNLGISSGA